ncbi:MAG TPA: hypothetical protein VNI77_05060 [Nitrososphaera sp.]|nr:hypothetical protein [Nitrososphaera sp.]
MVVYIILVTRFVEVPQLYLDYVVAAALGILSYMFWKEKGTDHVESQHGHIHHDIFERTEHEHMRWHDDMGIISTHTYMKRR